MTDADRCVAVLRERGPLSGVSVARELGIRDEDAYALLSSEPRCEHNGRKARASRWGVREVPADVDNVPTFATEELAARWERDLELEHYTAESFVGWFVEIGYLESVDGNGRVRVTELGRHVSWLVNEARQ